jgi:hypothetical protein
VRAFVLPTIAVVLVAAVLGIELAAGGAAYGPRPSADPCQPRPLPAARSGLDPLLEEIVLVGLDNAACRLGVSRERLVLSLAASQTMDPAAPAALKAGLRDAVDRLDRAGRLPKASQLLPEVLHRANLPGIVTSAIGLVPDSVIDSTLPTAPLLRRTIDGLNVTALLGEFGDPSRLQSSIESALLRAAEGEIVARLRPF